MSRSITQTSSSGSTVAAGSSVIVPVNTTTGFSAGDYVYTTPTGIGTRATGNTGIGLDTVYSATTFVSTYVQSASFRSVSYGPLQDGGTYSGTTRTGGSAVVSPTTINSSGPDTYNRSCTLTNGNVVQLTNDGSGNLYMTIVSNTGTVVLAKTTVATDYYVTTGSGNHACCALTSGGFAVVWCYGTGNYALKVQGYSSTGVAGTSNTISWVSATPYNICCTGLSGGGVAVVGNSSPSGNTNSYWSVVDSGFNYIGYGQFSSGLSANGKAPQCIGMPASYGTNIWVAYQYDTTGSGVQGLVTVNSGGTQGLSVVSTQYGRTGAGANLCNITVLTDGTIVIASPQYGGLYAEKYVYTKSTNTTGTISYSTSFTVYGNSYGGQFVPTANGGFFAVCNTSNVNPLRILQVDSSNTVTTVSNSVVSPDTNTPGKVAVTSWGGGVISITYPAASTGYPTYAGYTSIAATNGVTYLTGASYTPTQGYYLMGVAATDAAANSTGQVIVNGTAQLGSAYPTVTTPVYFSYQTTASQPIFGQRGVVNATTVTLKGLEA